MNLQREVKSLTNYIANLSSFRITDPGYPYNHMGATITDAMLQAGLKYKTVVEPRVKDLQVNYPDARTTSGFLELLEKEGVRKLLRWKHSEKPARVLGVARFFDEEGIETEEDLKTWLKKESNIAEFKKVRGVGNKTLDYFKMLSGIPTSAIDRHLIRFLEQAGIHASSYSEAKEIINKTAEQIGIGKSLLDHSIWKYMSTGKSKDDSCKSKK